MKRWSFYALVGFGTTVVPIVSIVGAIPSLPLFGIIPYAAYAVALLTLAYSLVHED